MKQFMNRFIKPLLKKAGALIKKRGWYILLLVVSTLYVIYYRLDFYDLSVLDSQSLVFIVWIVLLLLPLFSEVELLGVKVKKEIDKATGDIKESIRDLQLQIIQTQVSNSVATNILIDNNKSLPTEDSLNKLRESIKTPPETHANSHEVNLDKVTTDMESKVYLFKVRYSLETKARELCEKLGYSGQPVLSHMAQFLRKVEVLQGSMFEIVIQINRIANRGIHGEIISSEYLQFVKQAYPDIVRTLEEATKQLEYINCPRCKYSGYAVYENVCPHCNHTWVE